MINVEVAADHRIAAWIAKGRCKRVLDLSNLQLEEAIPALLIEGDSQLVINQVCGTWKINNAELKGIYTKIRALIADKFDYVAIRHVRRQYNKAADKITNDVLATKESFHTVYEYK